MKRLEALGNGSLKCTVCGGELSLSRITPYDVRGYVANIGQGGHPVDNRVGLGFYCQPCGSSVSVRVHNGKFTVDSRYNYSLPRVIHQINDELLAEGEISTRKHRLFCDNVTDCGQWSKVADQYKSTSFKENRYAIHQEAIKQATDEMSLRYLRERRALLHDIAWGRE